MIYVIGIGPGAPSYGLLGSEEIYQKADYILGSERHLEILPAAYQEKGVVPPKKLAAQEVMKRGLKKVLVIGENLSYEDEKIEILAEDQVIDRQYEMNVVVILNEGFGIY